MTRTLFLLTLALAACTSPETDLDRYNALVASVTVMCGGDYGSVQQQPHCEPEAQAQQALACMNDALSSGARAMWSVGSYDSDWFPVDTDSFTVDHMVEVFEYHPGQSRYSATPIATEKSQCTGPFELATGLCPFGGGMAYGLGLDGCP